MATELPRRIDKSLEFIFDGPPEDSPRLIEVERNGLSVTVGIWEQRGDRWVLILTAEDFAVTADGTP
jgi:hypothetical protein